ncbi:hypothetical protein EK21DRAFT_110346 [Setomelanomma holmii]|uniref:Uncharacterized protein n=1 Tax=Setomelanomma holmii TaxID=210430 RepID=A0A9P4HF52_9PLEO|nr:hypothetical protein EK21DRAFT_110346 [Setomelanomma holmii]
MVAPLDYIPSPWAKRCVLGHGDEQSDGSDSACPGETEALIRQLQEWHNYQQDPLSRVRSLEDELSQAHKREGAVAANLTAAYDKEANLKAQARVQEKESLRLEIGWGELQWEKNKLAKWKELEITEAKVATRAIVRKESNIASENEGPEDALDGTSNLNATAASEDRSHGLEDAEFSEPAFVVADYFDIQLLRRHDYYEGWYDCLMMMHKKRSGKETRSRDANGTNLATSPPNAGANAGILFAFVALCQEHKPEWSTRLDDRSWIMDLLFPEGYDKHDEFWVGFANGVEYAEKFFVSYLAEEQASVASGEGDQDNRYGKSAP